MSEEEYKWGEPMLEIDGKLVGRMSKVEYPSMDGLECPCEVPSFQCHVHMDKAASKSTVEALMRMIEAVRALSWACRYSAQNIRRLLLLRSRRFRSNVPKKLSRTRRKQRPTRLQRRKQRQTNNKIKR